MEVTMNRGNIFHRSFGNQCYALDENRLKISLTTGDDIEKVYICYGDPFDAGIMGGQEVWEGTKEEIKTYMTLDHNRIWNVVVEPKHKRLRYYFIVEDSKESLCFLEDGLFSKKELKNLMLPSYFVMPWLNSSDVNVTPKWVQDTVWYQIFPDRFCNGNPSINPEHCKKWQKGKVGLQDFYGGDIYGIKEKIPYLKDLGITGIYINPILKSSTNHKYNTDDYEVIDPHFGDDKIFKETVKLAHKNGIKVMVDAVFNHSGSDHPFWKDVQKNGEKSKYKDWYMVNKFPVTKSGDTRDNQFYSFAFTKYMPKLNTNNPEVIDYFTKICKKWITDWKIDGIRFDVANEVSHTFLKHLHKELKAINSNIYLIGEIWHDSIQWLMGDEFDSIMNYPLTFGIREFFLNKNMPSEKLFQHINRRLNMYYDQTNMAMFNLYDSHDTLRLINSVDFNLDIYYQLLTILFTMQGSPCIYYGTEVALHGGFDPDCRRCMPWDDIEKGTYKDITNKVKEIISLRNNHIATKSPNMEQVNNPNSRVVEYIKHSDNEDIKVIFNCSNSPIKVENVDNILFENGYNDNSLKENGTLVYKIK